MLGSLEVKSGIHYGAINGNDAASLSNALLNEAYAQDYVYNEEEENEEHDKPSFYKTSLDLICGVSAAFQRARQ